MPSDNKIKCSFCGKSQEQVKKLIAGPGVYICDECVDLCNEILDEQILEAGVNKLGQNVNATILQDSGPKKQESPRPLQTVPRKTIEASIESMECFIEAYEQAGKTKYAEPFYRTLLILKENEVGPKDEKLLPILEKLCNIYEKDRQYLSYANALEWTISIMDENEDKHHNKKEPLMKLAKMHIKLGNTSQAEAILDRISTLL